MKITANLKKPKMHFILNKTIHLTSKKKRKPFICVGRGGPARLGLHAGLGFKQVFYTALGCIALEVWNWEAFRDIHHLQ